jgi:hypothetical protein
MVWLPVFAVNRYLSNRVNPAWSILTRGNHRYEGAVTEQSIVIRVGECDGGGAVGIYGEAERSERAVRR